jgi:hypothetical protein
VEDDTHQCLYVGTPWEEEVIADRRDINDFKEASRMIGRVLSVTILVWALQNLALSHGILQGLIPSYVYSYCNHLLIEHKLV